jgi:hypothetical protein
VTTVGRRRDATIARPRRRRAAPTKSGAGGGRRLRHSLAVSSDSPPSARWS